MAGFGLGLAARSHVDPALYRGKEHKEAAHALLQLAERQAEDDTWGLIGVGRVYYLMGEKDRAEALFKRAVAQGDEDDIRRVAFVYAEAGEWERAAESMNRALARKGRDGQFQAETAAFLLRASKENDALRHLDEAFRLEPEEVWVTLAAASAFAGVPTPAP